jgi:hypothetical protein
MLMFVAGRARLGVFGFGVVALRPPVADALCPTNVTFWNQIGVVSGVFQHHGGNAQRTYRSKHLDPKGEVWQLNQGR